MSATRGRARLFWLLSTLVLPVANGPVSWGLSTLTSTHAQDRRVLALAGVLLVAESLALWGFARRVWTVPVERQWRVLLAVLALLVLTPLFVAAELYVGLTIGCRHDNCLS